MMNRLTRAQVYERLVQAANDGTMPGYRHGEGCSYLTSNGHRCAIGVFLGDLNIPENVQELVGEVWDLSRPLQNLLVEYTDLSVVDLARIQLAHDTACSNLCVGYEITDQEREVFKSRFLDGLSKLDLFRDVVK